MTTLSSRWLRFASEALVVCAIFIVWACLSEHAAVSAIAAFAAGLSFAYGSVGVTEAVLARRCERRKEDEP